MIEQIHTPVLVKEVLQALNPQKGDRYLDLTAGYGGHASEVINLIGKDGLAILVDRDQTAIQSLGESFSKVRTVQLLQQDFLSASKDLYQSHQKFDIIFADLGVSSLHLDSARRGFSFNKEGPLDMRMDQDQSLTAEMVVNQSSEAELARILKRYGEIRNSLEIAKLIIANRPYKTTTNLAKIIADNSYKWSKIHPATKVFQALRIYVNKELEMLERSLPIWLDLLSQDGRLAVISFHSLEDRLIKQFFNSHGGKRYDAELMVLTKKPIIGKAQEIVNNPRARSAKLRVAVKIKTQKGGCLSAYTGKKHLPCV